MRLSMRLSNRQWALIEFSAGKRDEMDGAAFGFRTGVTGRHIVGAEVVGAVATSADRVS
jgi:hypothetical protein